MPLWIDRRRSPASASHRRRTVLGFVVLLNIVACRDLATPDRALAPELAGHPLTPSALTRSWQGKSGHPGQYIVVFNSDVDDVPGLAKGLVKVHGGSLGRTYTGALHGFVASLPDSAVAALKHNPHVAGIEPDALVDIQDQESPCRRGDSIASIS
jgi:hypothetical protein